MNATIEIDGVKANDKVFNAFRQLVGGRSCFDAMAVTY
jgi:hypothetical protein